VEILADRREILARFKTTLPQHSGGILGFQPIDHLAKLLLVEYSTKLILSDS
jgi:hypothetical protein